MPGPSPTISRFAYLPTVLFRALLVVVPAVLVVTLIFFHFSSKPLTPASSAKSEPVPTEWQDSLIQKPAPIGTRPIFPYSIVPGGVRNAAELQAASSADPLVARHYSDFRIPQAHTIQLDHAVAMYVSYRRDDRVFWTRNRMLIPAGETLITDGENLARTRCANRLSPLAMKPVAATDPTAEELNEPSFVPPLMAGFIPAGETGFLPASAPLPSASPSTPPGPLGSPAPGGSVTPPVLPPILLPGGPPISNTPVTPPPPIRTPEPASLILLLAGAATTLFLAAFARRR